MSENCEKCRSVFPKAQEDVLECLTLSATIYSVYCQRSKKCDNIYIKEAGKNYSKHY